MATIPEQGLHGRQRVTKSIVAIAVETRGKGLGRVRLHQVPDLSAESLVGFVTDVVAPGGIVRIMVNAAFDPMRAREMIDLLVHGIRSLGTG